MFGSSARTSSGRAGPGEGPEKVLKSGNYSYSQRSKQASQGLAPHGTTATISTSTKVAAAHVQGRLEPQPEASSLAAESYARTCSVASHRGRTPICGLLHRKDFEVERICKKLLADTKVIYELRWKSSWVPAKLIVEGIDDEYSHVDADGIRWYIEESFSYREKNGIEEVKVGWMDTKEPVEMLSNAQQAIDIFEADLRLTGADKIAQVRQRTVLTIPESQFSRDSVLSQSEEDYDEAQRWVSSTWPEICPYERLDLYPAIYRIHMEIASPRRQKKRGGKSYRCLMKLPQLRPLRWNDDFLRSGAMLTCCRRKRASLFIQVTGTQVVRHCSRCSHGRLTPFLECVQTALDQQLWLNGACANCGTKATSAPTFTECLSVAPVIHPIVGTPTTKTFAGQILSPPSGARLKDQSHPTIAESRRESTAYPSSSHGNDESSDTSDDDGDDDDENGNDEYDGDNGDASATGRMRQTEAEA